jgi:carbonic anhydrase
MSDPRAALGQGSDPEGNLAVSHSNPADLHGCNPAGRLLKSTAALMLVANLREACVTVTDDYLANNANYASDFNGPLPLPPSKKIAVLACMDARIDVYRVLGINEGESHVIRNAGGVVTDDAIRSLAISQRLLGTQEIILIHHTDCGMLTFTDDEFKKSIQEETGIKPEWAAEAFSDLDDDVRQSIARIKASPFIPRKDAVRGFVYEVETGRLREVS